ncbi:MAG: dipeptidase [Parasphingorhabdus sp.]|nr:dipeptidase [Parasphingorhabdus sp.]
MKHILLWLALLLLGASVMLFTVAPGMVERSMNRVDGKPLPTVRREVQALHNSLTIVDLHADTLLWKRDLNDNKPQGHVDTHRLQAGGVTLQVFSSVTKTPRGQNYAQNDDRSDNITPLVIAQLQPPRTWFSLFERARWHARKLDKAVIASNGALVAIASSDQLRGLKIARGRGEKMTGVMFSAEGLQSLDGDRANLDRLYDVGLRMAGLTHFYDNELAGSMHGVNKGGLTAFGRQIMHDMEAKGIIVDVAHCSHACVADVLQAARRPVVSSHGGVQAACKVNRNLTDIEIRGIAATGGLIGLGYWDGAMCSTDPKAFARSAKYVRDLVGIDHVALGSDFDGAVTTRFDSSQLAQVTQALVDIGLSNGEIRAVMGENAMRVLEAGLKPMGRKAPTT